MALLRYLILYVILQFTGTAAFAQENKQPETSLTYEVLRAKQPLKIDADWDKASWKKVRSVTIEKYMGAMPAFKPAVEAKMMYDDENVFIIFRVKDRYVRSLVQEYNGNVSGDACVEFFFSPDAALPERYFNLEVNAGGTPLIFYVTKPWTGFQKLEAADIRQIEIAHSLPAKIDPEISEPVTWTIECRIPLSMLKKFSNVTAPARGVKWKANFYKTASQSTNPHWITWSYVNNPKPNFHLPQFFGTLIFK